MTELENVIASLVLELPLHTSILTGSVDFLGFY